MMNKDTENFVSVYGQITHREKQQLLLKTGKKKVPDALVIAVRHYLDCKTEK